MRRCDWAKSELAVAYHDAEWGRPVHEDRIHFEFLMLEGAQAGLSWEAILRKRERYRTVFAGFDPHRVSRFSSARIERLLRDPGIVRNRLKLHAAIQNAKAFLHVADAYGTFDRYIWSFVDGEPIRNTWTSAREVPAKTAVSEAMSKDLRRRGFAFVGPTICYAYMQAVGIVDDHLLSCFRRLP
jgi:DNA-3-methyladenine glycosylase I